MKGAEVASTSMTSTNSPVRRTHILSALKTFAVIFGGSLVIFVALSNTLTWYLQRFWGASADFWASRWDTILNFFGRDELNVCVFGTFFYQLLIYWVIGTIYTLIDLTGRPKFLLKYKIQDNAQYPVQLSRLLTVLKQVLINQILVGIPLVYAAYAAMRFRGYSWGPKLPTFQWVVFELACFVLIEEIAFYYSHRLLHHPKLYKHIHKRHHEWTAPIAVTAVYCHPIEYIFSNVLPVALGPLIMGSHVAVSWLWFTIAILSTLNAHCGFHFPFFPSPEAHDFHHLKFNQNFGVLGILDRLHGTDEMFRRSKAYQRHIMLLSLAPIKELIPDDPKTKNKCPQ